jgi:hypothetical protein
MDITTIINNNQDSNEQILRYIFDITKTMLTKTNLDMIIQSIDNIEDLTGYKLFNKSELCKQLIEIPNENLLLETKNLICKNVIMQIDFNTIFKSKLNFTFIFKDNIVILYKNKQVDATNILDIKIDLIQNYIDIFPIIYQVYIDTLCNIIMQFINNDLIVKYYCINIPIPYWKLFELKCNNINSKYNEKCKELDYIISGEYYKTKQTNINDEENNIDTDINTDIITDTDNEQCFLSTIDKLSILYIQKNISLTDIEYKILDNHYRMEVMAFLYDDEIGIYLEMIDKIDEFENNIQLSDHSYICTYIKTLVDASKIKNIIAKFYYVYKLYDFICKIPEFIKINKSFRITASNKLNEIIKKIHDIQYSDIKLTDAIILTINKTKELFDTIEKSIDPNYVSSWATIN